MFASRYRRATRVKFSNAGRSRTNDCTTRMPAMSSASVAVTRPSRSRTCAYARAERLRNTAVATLISGMTAHVARASRQSRTKRMMAVPTSVSEFCTRLVTTSTIAQFARPAATKTATTTYRRPPPRPATASSSAYFARYGGASAVAVAARSETTERAVRRRYGPVRLQRRPSRRRVFRQDQSSTAAPRSASRWPPGWWTLIPPRRQRRRRLRSSRRRSRDVLHLRASLDGVRELPLEETVLVDLAVDRARALQLLVRPARRDTAVVEDDDLVGERDRRQAVRDDQRRPVARRSAQPRADLGLRRRVDRRGRVVEDEDARIDRERSRDRDALALAARQGDPALADHGVVALGQSLDELVCLRGARGRLDGGVVEVAASERDVLPDGRREEEGVLRDDADLAAERVQLEIADVDAVDEHASSVHVVEARYQRRQRRLPGARVTDQRDRRPRCDVEIDVAQDRPVVQIGEPDVLEPDRARARRQLDRTRPVRDLLRLVDDLEDPLAGRGRALRLPDPHAERAQRHDEHPQVEVERDEAAGRQGAMRHHPRADEQHRRLHEERHERDQRHVGRALPVRLHGLQEDGIAPLAELLFLRG